MIKGSLVKVTLIISTYNSPQTLRLSLATVLRQTLLPCEIVIADDGSTGETGDMLKAFSSTCPIPVKHIWHEDLGFRKTIIMNKAVQAADGDYIIQIDGDILLHSRFIEDHLAFAEEGFFLRGGRSLIGSQKTKSYMKRDVRRLQKGHIMTSSNKLNAFRIPFLAKLISKESDDIKHVKGCNMSYWKKDFIRVNGYNNDINGWGHEDIELAIRFFNSGVRMKKVKFKAITFHLHHAFNSREDEMVNLDQFNRALSQKVKRAENGYDSL